MATAPGTHPACPARQPHPPAVLTVLTVLAEAGRRIEVHSVCTAAAPGARVIDAATVTDAVLTLLSERVDLLLVDVLWAGDMLPALQRHARRSAPDALVLLFGPAVHAWQVLEPMLRQRLSARPRRALSGAPAPAPDV